MDNSYERVNTTIENENFNNSELRPRPVNTTGHRLPLFVDPETVKFPKQTKVFDLMASLSLSNPVLSHHLRGRSYPSLRPSVTPHEDPGDGDMPLHQLEILMACETGDLPALKKLFDDAGVEYGNRATTCGLDTIHRSEAPATSDLLYTAIFYNQPPILRFLLEIYSGACLRVDTLLGSRGRWTFAPYRPSRDSHNFRSAAEDN